MRTEKEIKRKIDVLTKESEKTKKVYLNGKINYCAYSNKFMAINHFISAFNWILEEGKE